MRWRMMGPSSVALAAAVVTLLGGATAARPGEPVAVATSTSNALDARTPQIVHVSGDIHTHDPALTRDGARGDWYVFSTGDPHVSHGTVQIRRSSDLQHWRYAGTVFQDIPAWVRVAVPNVQNIWAPDVRRHGGLYYAYYAASSFGTNRSVIGL